MHTQEGCIFSLICLSVMYTPPNLTELYNIIILLHYLFLYDDLKQLTKIDKNDSNNAVIIPVFDIHNKNIGNGNEAGRMTTNAYEF